MCTAALKQYLFPVEVRGIHVSLVMHGDANGDYGKGRRGYGKRCPPHVVVLYPATPLEIRAAFSFELRDRELSQSSIEAAIALGSIHLIELETLHRLASELELVCPLPKVVEEAMKIAGPQIATLTLSIVHDVTSKLLASRVSPTPIDEGDRLIEYAIATQLVILDSAMVLYCRSFFEFLDSWLLPDRDSSLMPESDLYAVSLFRNS